MIADGGLESALRGRYADRDTPEARAMPERDPQTILDRVPAEGIDPRRLSGRQERLETT